MTFSEILNTEHENPSYLILHREGMFAKAYEESAYRLDHIRQASGQEPLKATKRHVRNINRDIVSVGLPFENAIKLLEGSPKVSEDASVLIFGASPVDESSFAQWRDGIPLREKSEAKQPKAEVPGQQHDLIRKITEFDLANSTPMECMQFIIELKSLSCHE